MMVCEKPPGETATDGQADVRADVHAAVIRAYERVALLASRSASLDEVLRLMSSVLCEQLGLHRCFVYLRREDGRFSGQIGYRAGATDFDHKVHGLITGGDDDEYTREIVDCMAPVIMADAPNDARVARRAIRRWGVSDMLGIPLVVADEVIGVIYLDDDGTPRTYDERDITFAKTFAGLCALAVRQCWMYHRLGERASRLDGQRKGLAELARIHDKVTRTVLDGADLDGVLRVVAELFGKPVVLYSSTMEPTAWAAPVDSGRTAAPALTPAQAGQPWIREHIARLATGAGSVMLRATRESLCRRLFVRLRAETDCLGYLELCELGRPFRAVDAQALEQAAVGVALKVVAIRREAEHQRQEREDFCTDLLYGRRDAAVMTRQAAALGLDARGRFLVVRAERTSGAVGSVPDHRRREELAGEVTRQLGRLGRTVAQVGAVGADILLVEVAPTESGEVEDRIEERLREGFPGLVERFGVRFLVVSDVTRGIGGLPERMDKLKTVAGLLTDTADTSEPRIVLPREFDLMLLMARGGPGHNAALKARELLAPLLAHDAATGASLVETLRVFVECRAQIRSTATALNVHENTVRYRLGRIRDLSSVDPERFDSLLSVSMAFQAHDLSGARLAPPTEQPRRRHLRRPATMVAELTRAG